MKRDILSLSLVLFLSACLCGQENQKLSFDAVDTFGRRVTAQDYEGVPVFLSFGACW